MSTEPETFLTRWSRRKRAAELEAERPADSAAPQPPSASATDGGRAAGGDAAATAAAAPAREPDPATAMPLPPIESLDGLRSDYEAFFQQPVGEELRHAALKKLFADPHFNKMDMLDVYVDDYTQFEPLPAAMRMRLPSARRFLLDSERAALDAAEAPTDAAGDASGTVSHAVGQDTEPATSQAVDERRELAGNDTEPGSPSELRASAAPVASVQPHAPSPDARPGNSTPSDPPSS